MFIFGQVIRRKGLTTVVQQRFIAPTGDRQLLVQSHHYLIRPDAPDLHMGNPGHLLQIVTQSFEINLEDNLLLFFTGYSRSAGPKILTGSPPAAERSRSPRWPAGGSS